MSSARTRRTYSGVNGMKGLALVAIIVYHLKAAALPGGFVGVDVFLTISGFLVGTSMMRSLYRTGRIDYPGYLLRRVRRILPALLLLVPLAAIIARAVDVDMLVRIQPQVAAGIACVYNWYAIVTGSNYFDAMNQKIFQHLWFVGILMQCYVVSPLLLTGLWKLQRKTGRRHLGIVCLVALAALSLVLMAALYNPTAPTRVYEGTDTHCGGFLLGLALAWALTDREARDEATALKRARAAGAAGSDVTRVQAARPAYGARAQVPTQAARTQASQAALASQYQAQAAYLARYGAQAPVNPVAGRQVPQFLAPQATVDQRAAAQPAPTAGHFRSPSAQPLQKQVQQQPKAKAGSTARPSAPSYAEAAGAPSRRLAKALPYLAFCSLVGLLVLSFALGDANFAFRGGIAISSVLSVLLIWGTVAEGSWMQGLFEMPPLALLGKYSYGVYLWHWPMWLFMSNALKGTPIEAVVAAALVLTVLAAAISNFLVEEPGARIGSPKRDDADYMRVRMVAAVVIIVACLVGCFVVVKDAPAQTKLEAQLAQMEKEQAKAQAEAKEQAKKAAEEAAKQKADEKAAAEAAKKEAEEQAKLSKQMPTGDQMDAVGDSVMLFCSKSISDTFPGIYIDAKSSRNWSMGMPIVQDMKNQGTLRKFLLVALASNTFMKQADLDQLRSIVGDDTVLVLIGAHGPLDNYPRYPEMNDMLKKYAEASPKNTVFVDWDAAISPHLDLLGPDGVHPKDTAKGGAIYAQAIHDALAAWVKANGGK